MLDLALLGVLGLLSVRGWMRGLIRAAVSLAVIVVGTFLALRLNGAVGSIVESMVGLSANVSRMVGGVLIFLVVSIGAGVLVRVLQLGARLLPGVTTLNRVGGAVFSASAGLIVMTLLFSIVAVVNPSESISDRLDESAIVSFLIDDDGFPQTALGVVAGDRILATTLRLQDLFGEPQLLATEATTRIPQTAESDLKVNSKAADRLIDRANRLRVRADLAPLARAQRLDALALEQATEIATEGRFSLLGASGENVQDRIDLAGLRFRNAVEIVALGATAPSMNDAIEEDERASGIVTGDHRRIGVAVLRTANGLVAVMIYSS